MTDDIFQLRPVQPGDMGFIVNSWVRSYENSPFARALGPAYLNLQDTIAKRIIAKEATLVLCLSDDPETIVGWACTGENVVHYVYVKSAWRKRGLAKRLLAPYMGRSDVAFTHEQDGRVRRWLRKGRQDVDAA